MIWAAGVRLLSRFGTAGCVLLALGLVGGALYHQRTSRSVPVDELRRNLAAHAARVNAAIESGVCSDFRELDFVLQRIRDENPKRIAWMQLRDESGAVRARVGMRASATFPLAFARSQLQRRQPVFAVTQTQAGPVLLEVFPVRLPRGSGHSTILPVVNETERFGVIEIAAHLDGGTVEAPGAQRGFAPAGLPRMLFL